MKKVTINATSPGAKQMLNDPKIKKELEAIYDVKANPNNPIKWYRVYNIFQSTMKAAIRSSSISKLHLSNDQIETKANEVVRKAVIDYDVNNPQGAKPATFIYSRINFELSRTIRSGRMISGTDANERAKVLVNKAENFLLAQNKPATPRSISKFLNKNGYQFSSREVQKAQLFNVAELSGSQTVGGDDTSGSSIMTFQEIVDAKQGRTPREILEERNKMLLAYNSIPSFNDREFVKAVLWILDDRLGLGMPVALSGKAKPKNFKELCGIYKIGWDRGKKIYNSFIRAAGAL